MKKIILLTSFISISAIAETNNSIGPAGCGLGNLLFGKDHQIMAATTNHSSWNQMFGITSGTSNCVDSATEAQLDQFVKVNQLALANDMARGSGETLAGISKILGCQNQDIMAQTLKENLEFIYQKSQASSKDIAKNIREVLKNRSVVCSHLG